MYTNSATKLDEIDLGILALVQDDARMSSREMARALRKPVSSVFARMKRLEKLGLIRKYSAVLNPLALGLEACAFILCSFNYRQLGEGLISQRDVAQKVARFDDVQEVHIISGDWDLIIKVRARNVQEVGSFVVDKLRTVKGIDKTVTCMVFQSVKDGQEIGRGLLMQTVPQQAR